MKKAYILLLIVILTLQLFGCTAKHYDEDNISELYDKAWILGRPREEIVLRYGHFQREKVRDSGECVASYYVNYEHTGIDPSYIHDTYVIVFNSDGIATDAYFRKTSIGG